MNKENLWRILLLDTKRSNPNHYLCLGLHRALKQHPDVDLVISANLGEAIARARESGCNLFIAFDGEELHRGICARLAALCGRSILWVTEDPYETTVNIQNSAFFDLVFSNDSASVSRYGDKGRHLPLASDPDLHFLEVQEDNSCLYDLFFAGTAWPNRVALLKQIIDHISDLKTKLVLPHNEHLPAPSKTLPLPESAYSWRMPNSQFVQFANRSRVTLSLHREFTSSPGGSPMAMTPGPRLFEVALAGGFQLVDLALQETEDYFTKDLEFVGFHSPGEAIEKLKYYLKHPDERLAIARAGQVRASLHHTYLQRVEMLLSAAVGIPKKSPAEVANFSKTRILYVTHNLVGIPPYGGVEIYQDLVAHNLTGKDQFEILFYVPDCTGEARKIRLFDNTYRLLKEFKFQSIVTQELLTDREREQSFARVLAEYSIDIVHFQHLLGHVPSLPYIAKAYGIPTVISIHDYYAVCWSFNLLNQHGSFCSPESITETTCDICVDNKLNGQSHSQQCRRGFYGRMLENVTILHCGTEEVARRLCAVYPQLKEHPDQIVRGIPIHDGVPHKNTERQQPMRVVLVGNFSYNKGAVFLMELFSLMREDPVRFDILGNMGSAEETAIRRLKLPNVIIRGGYAPGNQLNLLSGASVALFASIWPETYCLSLSEAWQAGLVPVAPEIGAFSERINHGVNGFKYQPGQLGNLVDLIRLLGRDKHIIRNIAQNINKDLYATENEHCRWLTGMYTEMAQKIKSFSELSQFEEMEEVTLADCGIALTSPGWLRRKPSPPIESPVIRAPVTNNPTRQLTPNHYQRTLSYFRRYGPSATARRVMNEIRNRVIKGQ